MYVSCTISDKKNVSLETVNPIMFVHRNCDLFLLKKNACLLTALRCVYESTTPVALHWLTCSFTASCS